MQGKPLSSHFIDINQCNIHINTTDILSDIDGLSFKTYILFSLLYPPKLTIIYAHILGLYCSPKSQVHLSYNCRGSAAVRRGRDPAKHHCYTGRTLRPRNSGDLSVSEKIKISTSRCKYSDIRKPMNLKICALVNDLL